MKDISIDKISPNPNQPRARFVGIAELAANIKDKGLLEPIMVRPIDGGFQIIHGERRFRACKQIGMKDIPASIRDVDEKEAFELAIIENVQREDLTPIEEAKSYKRLQGEGYKQDDIASMIGKGRSYVAQKLRLLKMPGPLTFYLQSGDLTENHLRQIVKLKNIYGKDLMAPLVERISKNWLKETDKELDGAFTGFFVHALRPEEHPPMICMKANRTVFEAIEVFIESVSKHNSELPQWELAAFWWASMSVFYNVPVATLGIAIDLWRERYESALLWLSGSGGLFPSKTFEPKEDDPLWKKAEWWGYYSDLKHSGSLEVELSIERKEELSLSCCKKGDHVFPSCFQRWAPGHESFVDSYAQEKEKLYGALPEYYEN